jgi:hypothetical protein
VAQIVRNLIIVISEVYSTLLQFLNIYLSMNENRYMNFILQLIYN